MKTYRILQRYYGIILLTYSNPNYCKYRRSKVILLIDSHPNYCKYRSNFAISNISTIFWKEKCLILVFLFFLQLFSVRTMQRLCMIDSIIDREISSNGLNATNLKLLPFSFNLPYYTTCLNMANITNSCSSLNSSE